MHHHYGRHGPHAWLRWHKRRYARFPVVPTSVAPPAPTIFYMFVPTTTERIIFIIMSDGSINEAWRSQEEAGLPVIVPDYSLQDTRDRREDLPMLNHVK